MACPVCFGAAEPAVRESVNAGIFVLLGVTAAVLAGFVRFFMNIARRSRMAAREGPPYVQPAGDGFSPLVDHA